MLHAKLAVLAILIYLMARLHAMLGESVILAIWVRPQAKIAVMVILTWMG